MSNGFKFGLLVLLVFSICSGCASRYKFNTEPNDLDVGARAFLKELDVVILARSEGLVLPKPEKSNVSSATGGGAIPALVDVFINNNRAATYEELNTLVKESLIDIDHADLLKTELEEQIKSIQWTNLKNIKILRLEPDWYLKGTLVQDLIDESSASALMLLNPFTVISQEYDLMKDNLGVIIYPLNSDLSPFKMKPNDDPKRSLDDNIFRQSFLVETALGNLDDKEANAKFISSDGNVKFKTDLQKSAETLITKLIDELLSNSKKEVN